MERIVLNVGGRRFEATRATLVRIPYVHNMLEDVGGGDREEIFIERSSAVFKHVLAFAIDPKHPYPLALAYELDFYDVAYEEAQLFDAEAQLHALGVQLSQLQRAIPFLYNGLANAHYNASDTGNAKCVKGCGRSVFPGQLLCSHTVCRVLCAHRGCETATDHNLCPVHEAQYDRNCTTKGCPNNGPNRFCFLHSGQLLPICEEPGK